MGFILALLARQNYKFLWGYTYASQLTFIFFVGVIEVFSFT
jgi:hypothetical protein